MISPGLNDGVPEFFSRGNPVGIIMGAAGASDVTSVTKRELLQPVKAPSFLLGIIPRQRLLPDR